MFYEMEGWMIVNSKSDWLCEVKKIHPHAIIETNGNRSYAVVNGDDVGFYGIVLGKGRIKLLEKTS